MQIDGVGKKKIYPTACGLLGFRCSRTEWAAAWAELRHSLMLISLHPPWARLLLFPSTGSAISAVQACTFIRMGSPVVTPHLYPQDWPWLTLLKPLNFFFKCSAIPGTPHLLFPQKPPELFPEAKHLSRVVPYLLNQHKESYPGNKQ